MKKIIYLLIITSTFNYRGGVQDWFGNEFKSIYVHRNYKMEGRQNKITIKDEPAATEAAKE